MITTDLQKDQIIQLMKAGLSQNQAALKSKIKPGKVTYWKRRDPEFKTTVDKLRIAWARKWGYNFGQPIQLS